MSNCWDEISPNHYVYWWAVANSIYSHARSAELAKDDQAQFALQNAVYHRCPEGSPARNNIKYMLGRVGYLHEPCLMALRDKHITREQLLGLMILILG